MPRSTNTPTSPPTYTPAGSPMQPIKPLTNHMKRSNPFANHTQAPNPFTLHLNSSPGTISNNMKRKAPDSDQQETTAPNSFDVLSPRKIMTSGLPANLATQATPTRRPVKKARTSRFPTADGLLFHDIESNVPKAEVTSSERRSQFTSDFERVISRNGKDVGDFESSITTISRLQQQSYDKLPNHVRATRENDLSHQNNFFNKLDGLINVAKEKEERIHEERMKWARQLIAKDRAEQEKKRADEEAAVRKAEEERLVEEERQRKVDEECKQKEDEARHQEEARQQALRQEAAKREQEAEEKARLAAEATAEAERQQKLEEEKLAEEQQKQEKHQSQSEIRRLLAAGVPPSQIPGIPPKDELLQILANVWVQHGKELWKTQAENVKDLQFLSNMYHLLVEPATSSLLCLDGTATAAEVLGTGWDVEIMSQLRELIKEAPTSELAVANIQRLDYIITVLQLAKEHSLQEAPKAAALVVEERTPAYQQAPEVTDVEPLDSSLSSSLRSSKSSSGNVHVTADTPPTSPEHEDTTKITEVPVLEPSMRPGSPMIWVATGSQPIVEPPVASKDLSGTEQQQKPVAGVYQPPAISDVGARSTARKPSALTPAAPASMCNSLNGRGSHRVNHSPAKPMVKAIHTSAPSRDIQFPATEAFASQAHNPSSGASKKKACIRIIRGNDCPYGDQCRNEHDLKKVLCRHYAKTGRCRNKDNCKFRH